MRNTLVAAGVALAAFTWAYRQADTSEAQVEMLVVMGWLTLALVWFALGLLTERGASYHSRIGALGLLAFVAAGWIWPAFGVGAFIVGVVLAILLASTNKLQKLLS